MPPQNQGAAIAEYKGLIRQMSQAHQYLLLYVLDLLSVFARKCDKNLMTAQSEFVLLTICPFFVVLLSGTIDHLTFFCFQILL